MKLIYSTLLINLVLIYLVTPNLSLDIKRNEEVTLKNKKDNVIEITIKETTNKKNNVIHNSVTKGGNSINQNINLNGNKNKIEKNNNKNGLRIESAENKLNINQGNLPNNNVNNNLNNNLNTGNGNPNKNKILKNNIKIFENNRVINNEKVNQNLNQINKNSNQYQNLNQNNNLNLNQNNELILNNKVNDGVIEVKSVETPLAPLAPVMIVNQPPSVTRLPQMRLQPQVAIPPATIQSQVNVLPNFPSPAPLIPPTIITPGTPITPKPLIQSTIQTAQVGNSLIKQETMEYTLPAIPIDSNHRLEYYYPYFYKTHILEYDDNLDTKDSSNICPDLGCEWCRTTDTKTCRQCRHGYYLYNNQCFSVCPQNYVADIFKRQCHPLNVTNTMTQVSYLKAFTVGSCKNLCGKVSQDCSCLPQCIMEGNCCSDYNQCENLINKNNLRHAECNKLNPNCDLCEDFASLNCGQCKEGLFNRNGECLQSCIADDILMPLNKICTPNQHCLVQNCGQCVQGNPSVCRTCANGFYMYNNQCLENCPFRMRADRINWVCLEPPVFAWYWIFPSKASCRQRCGRLMDSIEMDCSCHQDCFRFANCCQDVEDFCPQFAYWK